MLRIGKELYAIARCYRTATKEKWNNLQIVWNARLNQLLHKLHRILEMNIVVASSMHEKQSPFEFGGGVDHGEGLVSI